MDDFLNGQPTAITEYDEQLVRRLIEKVIVYEDKFTVEFKSGMTVDVEENKKGSPRNDMLPLKVGSEKQNY